MDFQVEKKPFKFGPIGSTIVHTVLYFSYAAVIVTGVLWIMSVLMVGSLCYPKYRYLLSRRTQRFVEPLMVRILRFNGIETDISGEKQPTKAAVAKLVYGLFWSTFGFGINVCGCLALHRGASKTT